MSSCCLVLEVRQLLNCVYNLSVCLCFWVYYTCFTPLSITPFPSLLSYTSSLTYLLPITHTHAILPLLLLPQCMHTHARSDLYKIGSIIWLGTIGLVHYHNLLTTSSLLFNSINKFNWINNVRSGMLMNIILVAWRSITAFIIVITC